MDDRISPVPHSGLNTALWAVQVFLFVAFGIAGFMKLTMSMEDLARLLTWPEAVPSGLVRFIGFAELAGAVGVLIPALTRIQPWLTGYAAMGLTTVMICAVGYHLMLFQGMMLVPSIVLGALAGFVAWGRSTALPFVATRG
jgi:putative oxidoreductase